MASKGWISIHRKIQEDWVWTDKPFSKGQAWIDLLLNVNHEDNVIIFDGKPMEIKRGSYITSMKQLCDRWGWSNTKVKNFLEILEKDGKITLAIQPRKATAISIVNYSKYQDSNVSKNDTEASEEHQRNVTETSQKHINNNDNNENNVNKDDDIGNILQDKILSEINILVSNQLSSSRLNDLISRFGIGPINILVEEIGKSTWLRENITWNISQGFLDKVIAGNFRDYKSAAKDFQNFEGQTKSYTKEELDEIAKRARKRRKR